MRNIKNDRGHIFIYILPYVCLAVLFIAAAIPRYQALVKEGSGALVALSLAALTGGLTVGVVILDLLALTFLNEKWSDLLQHQKEKIVETRPVNPAGEYPGRDAAHDRTSPGSADAAVYSGIPHYREEQDWYDGLSLIGTALLFFGAFLASWMQNAGFGYHAWMVPGFGLVLLLWYLYLRKVPVFIVFPDGIKVRTGFLRKLVLVERSGIVEAKRRSFGRLLVTVMEKNGSTRDIIVRDSDIGWYCEENNIPVRR